MNFNRRTGQLAVLAIAAYASAGSAMAAPEYATIVMDTPVNAPADVVWKKIGGFCDIKTALKFTCVYSSGSGDVGTVRRLADRIDEMMVAKTPLSYTYSQPTTPIAYHGTLAVQADGPKKSKIVYTLFYDEAPLATPEAKAADRAQRTKRFTAVIESLKAEVEGK